MAYLREGNDGRLNQDSCIRVLGVENLHASVNDVGLFQTKQLASVPVVNPVILVRAREYPQPIQEVP